MAAGVNFNNVWAARGIPVDVTKSQARWGEPTDFHIVGSDASGIVYAVGADVTNVAGRRPRRRAPGAVGPRRSVGARRDGTPGSPASFRVWGYDSCWGSMAQFTKVQDSPVPAQGRPPHLGGGRGAHADRRHRLPDALRLAAATPCSPATRCWSGAAPADSARSRSSSLRTRAAGRSPSCAPTRRASTARPWARPATSTGSRSITGACRRAWDSPEWKGWFDGAKAFGKAFWEALGEKASPRIVFEHPGQDTIPTSNFVCDRGGMIVICAGTTGYDTMIDVRYLWFMQKRYQGSHLMNDEQAIAFNDLVREGKIVTTLGHTYALRGDPTRTPADGRRETPRGQRELPRERGDARPHRRAGLARQRIRSRTPSGKRGVRTSTRSTRSNTRATSSSLGGVSITFAPSSRSRSVAAIQAS